MTRKEAINMLKSKMDGHTDTSYEWAETVRMAIKALEQEPCENAISRQAVWDVMQELWGTSGELMDRLMALPSVTPMQRWIPVSERLPKPYEQVLRTVKSIGWNGTSNIYVDLGTICPIDTDVIAWMPLPKPFDSQESKNA